MVDALVEVALGQPLWIKTLWVFFVSMVPIVELRGAIPIGFLLDLPLWLCFTVSCIGNFLPVPFILLFIRRILNWMKGVRFLRFDKIALWVERKAQKHSAKVMKGVASGLFVFVAIPLPGTGAWTGSLVAALFDMRLKYAIPAIALGILVAGVIMSLVSYGILGGIFTVFA